MADVAILPHCIRLIRVNANGERDLKCIVEILFEQLQMILTLVSRCWV